MMKKLSKIISDQSGAVAVDWVALTASVVVLGIAFAYAVFGASDSGVNGLVNNFTAELGQAASNLVGVASNVPPPLQ
ncbi:MAG: hypothetical protein AAF401_10610 [Pseudomonadota bacterium]